MALIPARYVGNHAAQLSSGLGPFYNIDGTRRQSLILDYGDTLLMPDEEILGFTLLHDPHMVKDSLKLGVGWRVLPEHAALSPDELSALGYERHLGRTDMEPFVEASVVEPTPPVPPQAQPEASQSIDPALQNDPLVALANMSIGGQA